MKMVSQSENLDGFKLIIAIILLLISILLLLRPIQRDLAATTERHHEEAFERQNEDIARPQSMSDEESRKPDTAGPEQSDEKQPPEQAPSEPEGKKPDRPQSEDMPDIEKQDQTSQQKVEGNEKKLPVFPEAPEKLYYSVQDQSLYSLDGTPVYRLDSESNHWVPAISDDIKKDHPDAEIKQLDGQWAITETRENVYYSWDAEQMAWIAVQPDDDTTTPQTEETVYSDAVLEQSIALNVCPMPLASRIENGMTVITLRTLNQRSQPVIEENILLSNPPDTLLEIVSGPKCTPYQDRAYLWWEVKTLDGISGWCAEGSLYGKEYFLEPIE